MVLQNTTLSVSNPVAIVCALSPPNFTKNIIMKNPLSHRISSALAALSLFALASATNAQQGGVAVLDIDKVAKTMGIEDNVKNSLKEIEENLNNQLRTIQNELQARFDNLRSQVGPEPTQEQAQELAKINGQLTQQLTQSRTQAQSQLNAKQFELVSEFREKVKPVALEIAESKGLSIVVTPDQSLFAFSDNVDITEAVTAEMKKVMPAQAAAAEASASDAASDAATEAAPAPAAAPAAPKATPTDQ